MLTQAHVLPIKDPAMLNYSQARLLKERVYENIVENRIKDANEKADITYKLEHERLNSVKNEAIIYNLNAALQKEQLKIQLKRFEIDDGCNLVDQDIRLKKQVDR